MKKELKSMYIAPYSENPDLGFSVVETYNGKTEYRKNTRHVKGKYYSVYTDIFYIESEDTWYRITSDKIEKDWETDEWFLKGTKYLTKGIVDTDDKGNPVYGLFTANVYNNCQAKDNGGTCIVMNPTILKGDWYEDVAQNIWYRSSYTGVSEMKQRQKIRNEKSYTNKGYNIEDNASEFEQKKDLYKNYDLKIGIDARRYGKFLENMSFGCEFETSEGAIPKFVENRHGLVACRDGSLEGGGEFVTVPMSGAKGIQNIIEICKELQKRTHIDIRCAFHIHFGNLSRERVYLVALYMLCYAIQDEVFKMFPYYKLDHRGIKRKNYCQKLQKMSIYSLKDQTKEGYDQFVECVYKKIFEFLSDGHEPDDEINRTNHRHPIEQKWNRHNRYYWQNFINMLFSKSETAESRLHCPTLNPQRAVNWLFMNAAILKYAENNMKKIISGEKISFIDVLNHYKNHYKTNADAKFLSDYLVGYYEERSKRIEKDIINGDKVSSWTIDQDSKYKYEFGGKSLFVK